MIPTYSYIIYREREREITLYDDTIGHFGHIRIIIKIFVLHFRGMKHTMGGGGHMFVPWKTHSSGFSG
jgi:hypothetical protein